MLFDAIINLFKTICIGAIALSPLLVYKLTEEHNSNNYNTETSNEFQLQNSESKDDNKAESTTSNSSVGIFKNSNFFASGGIAPPPPPGEDVPIDDGVWVLLIFAIGYAIKKYNFSGGISSKANPI